MHNHTTEDCDYKKQYDEHMKGKTSNASANTKATMTANTVNAEQIRIFNVNGKGKQPMITLIGQQQGTDNQNVFEVEALADMGADACIMDKTKWKSIPERRSTLGNVV